MSLTGGMYLLTKIHKNGRQLFYGNKMVELDGHYLATRIVNHILAELRSYFPEGKRISTLRGSYVNFREPTFIEEQTIWPLERIRDKMSKCNSSVELEPVMDMFIEVYQRFLRIKLLPSEMWGLYLDKLNLCMKEINFYILHQYFPNQKRTVSVSIKVRKAFLFPVSYAPIKVYFGSDCIQNLLTSKYGKLTLHLPEGFSFTFLALKGKRKNSRREFLSGNTRIRL